MAGYVSRDGREQFVVRTFPWVMEALSETGKAINGEKTTVGKSLEAVMEPFVKVLGDVVVIKEVGNVD